MNRALLWTLWVFSLLFGIAGIIAMLTGTLVWIWPFAILPAMLYILFVPEYNNNNGDPNAE